MAFDGGEAVFKAGELGLERLVLCPEGKQRGIVGGTDGLVLRDGVLGRVLCIEDAPDGSGLIQHLLAKLGANAVMAKNGNDAEALVEADAEFDVVMVAHRPGGSDGVETIRTLRDKGCKAPVILLTADADEPAKGLQKQLQALAALCRSAGIDK